MDDDLVLTESSVVVAAEHITSTQVEGERVLLDLEDGIYYGLNPVGARIWEEIQAPTSVDDVVHILTTAYDDVGREQCLEDTLALLADLQENELVEIQSS